MSNVILVRQDIDRNLSDAFQIFLILLINIDSFLKILDTIVDVALDTDISLSFITYVPTEIS
jgi:hypothetical protein